MPELLSQDEGAFTAGVQEAGEQTQQDRRADKRHKENGRGRCVLYRHTDTGGGSERCAELFQQGAAGESYQDMRGRRHKKRQG